MLRKYERSVSEAVECSRCQSKTHCYQSHSGPKIVCLRLAECSIANEVLFLFNYAKIFLCHKWVTQKIIFVDQFIVLFITLIFRLREYDAMPQTKTGMTKFFFQNFLGFLASFYVKNHQKSVRWFSEINSWYMAILSFQVISRGSGTRNEKWP